MERPAIGGARLTTARRVVREQGSTIVLWCAAAVTTLFVVRLLGAAWRSGFPIFFPDSSSFLGIARRGPFSWSFWFGERPVVTPLVSWMLVGNVRLVVLAQTLLYVASGWWLAIVLCRIVSSRVAQFASVVGVVAFAVQPRFAVWNTHVLSESISISLSTAAVAAWLGFAHRPSTRSLSIGWGVTALWAMTRDTNVLVAVVCTVPWALAASHWWSSASPELRRLLRRGAFGMLILAAYVTASQAESDRNRYPTLNVIGQRVLVDAELTEYYEGFGMPLDDALLGRRGKVSWDDGEAFLRDPALQGLRDWAETRGQLVHLSSMIRFGPRFVERVWDDVPSNLATDHDAYDLFGVHDRLPVRIPLGLGGPRDGTQLAGWSMVAAVGLGALVIGRRRRRHAAVLTLGLLSVALDVYLSWLGDSVEVQRHLVTAVARLGVVLVATVVIGFDELFRRSDAAPPLPTDDATEDATDTSDEPVDDSTDAVVQR